MKKYERLDTTKFIERARAVHGDKYDYSKVEYQTAHKKVMLQCKACGYEWEVFPHNHLGGNGCKQCQYKSLPQNQSRTHEEFVKLARDVHGNKYEYLTPYATNKKKLKIKCNKCKFVFEQRASSHLEGCGCRRCQYNNLPQNQPREVEVFEERCRKVHDDRYEYCGDYRGGRYKIKIWCKTHKEHFHQNADAHLLKKQGCPKCCLSKGEIKIEKWLKSHKVKYDYERRFPGCKLKFELPFDFYLPDYNLCVEYDGAQHYYPITKFGGKKTLLATQKRDKIKTDFCAAEGIDLLRIPFFEYKNIEKMLEQKIC